MTANGEIFDRGSVAAAHTTMPLPSYARVTNLRNGHSIIVRVNDRGPFHGNRIIDVSQKTAEALDFRQAGTAPVRVEYVGRASTNGSDDEILLASLRTDGGPASLSAPSRTLFAEAPQARPSVPSNALAWRRQEAEVSLSEATGAPAQAVLPVAAQIPLPPERPFDLGTIPHAATPVATSARPVVAGLYFAPYEPPQAGLNRAMSFQTLQSRDIVGQRSRF
jgi:rare lipoprotein A